MQSVPNAEIGAEGIKAPRSRCSLQAFDGSSTVASSVHTLPRQGSLSREGAFEKRKELSKRGVGALCHRYKPKFVFFMKFTFSYPFSS